MLKILSWSSSTNANDSPPSEGIWLIPLNEAFSRGMGSSTHVEMVWNPSLGWRAISIVLLGSAWIIRSYILISMYLSKKEGVKAIPSTMVSERLSGRGAAFANSFIFSRKAARYWGRRKMAMVNVYEISGEMWDVLTMNTNSLVVALFTMIALEVQQRVILRK